jgi:hypothetical protein
MSNLFQTACKLYPYNDLINRRATQYLRREWIAAIQYLGPKWILAGKVGRKCMQ